MNNEFDYCVAFLLFSLSSLSFSSYSLKTFSFDKTINTHRFVMTSISSANKEQSLTEKEKRIEVENTSKLVNALGVD